MAEQNMIIFLVFLAASSLALPFPFNFGALFPEERLVSARQVGQGVNGNQTGNSGSVSSGGTGDGNGVGFAGIGNDIDTGDDFDIGDGNNTIGDGNTIEIGDRITEVTNINLGSGNFSSINVGPGGGRTNGTNKTADMSININLRVMVEDGRVSIGVV
ncbi:hypothetical protein CGCS363_v004134 [Colletotrichum siamense]|uniref:uncharacterized protein n=1 Tax=Colletotrichum siamense TaxID=690259 RepID=UPI0018728CB5|nr:uncharacterized protein CGCS363_v004134 [Colletotrichum siamense]KAF5505111.1 hypothetical protein CGCS363_v004134 [Colletotrichum siamense]